MSPDPNMLCRIRIRLISTWIRNYVIVILSVPKFTARVYCICLSVDIRFTLSRCRTDLQYTLVHSVISVSGGRRKDCEWLPGWQGVLQETISGSNQVFYHFFFFNIQEKFPYVHSKYPYREHNNLNKSNHHANFVLRSCCMDSGM